MAELDPQYAGEGIYRENILDHYKNPRNTGSLEGALQHREFNPVCGDDITVSLDIANGTLKDMRFLGRGCAISQASMSMLSETIIGKPISHIKTLERDDLLSLLGIPIGVVRMKCAMLGLVAVKRALNKMEKR